MLKTRVITALLMAAIGLVLVFLAPAPVFAILVALLLLGLGGRESARLAGYAETWQALAYAALLLTLAGVWLLAGSPAAQPMLGAAAALWLALIWWLTRPQAGHRQGVLKLVVLGAVLWTAWLAAITLQQASPWLVLMLVIIIAAADIGAYFTGRSIGGPKLAPAISPGKTISGAFGGVLAAAAVAAGAALAVPQAPFSPAPAALIAILLALLSIGGDLFISLLKRQRGLKDTSALLPGHGGILDRFDSLAAALPFFALAWLWWGQ